MFVIVGTVHSIDSVHFSLLGRCDHINNSSRVPVLKLSLPSSRHVPSFHSFHSILFSLSPSCRGFDSLLQVSLSMSCTPTPTATLYATVSTFTPSTSYSQSAADTQAQLTTIVQQSCVASGTISGSSVGCISSVQVTEVNTLGGEYPCPQPSLLLSSPSVSFGVPRP